MKRKKEGTTLQTKEQTDNVYSMAVYARGIRNGGTCPNDSSSGVETVTENVT